MLGNNSQGNLSHPSPGRSNLFAISDLVLDSWLGIGFVCVLCGAFFGMLLLASMAQQVPFAPRSTLLLFHLVLLDFVCASIIFPIQNVGTFQQWKSIPENEDCAAVMFTYQAFVYVESWNALVLGITRFMAVISPQRYTACTTRKAVSVALGFCWLVGTGLNAIPHVVSHGKFYGRSPFFGDCGMTPGYEVYAATLLIVGNIIPVMALVLLYVALHAVTVIKHNKARPYDVTAPNTLGNAAVTFAAHPSADKAPSQDNSRLPRAERQRNLTRSLSISSIWHALCFLPVPMCVLVSPVTFFTNLPLQLWVRNLSLMGYAFNPIIFLALNREYRHNALRLLRGHWSGEHGDSNTNSKSLQRVGPTSATGRSGRQQDPQRNSAL